MSINKQVRSLLLMLPVANEAGCRLLEALN
jgi:hypothetical protein